MARDGSLRTQSWPQYATRLALPLRFSVRGTAAALAVAGAVMVVGERENGEENVEEEEQEGGQHHSGPT